MFTIYVERANNEVVHVLIIPQAKLHIVSLLFINVADPATNPTITMSIKTGNRNHPEEHDSQSS
jgi:hypothetical protein